MSPSSGKLQFCLQIFMINILVAPDFKKKKCTCMTLIEFFNLNKEICTRISEDDKLT